MIDGTHLLNTIAASLNELNKSEAKVAQAILQDPEQATRSSIAALALSAGVSEPSVNRFCKRFGAKGFPDFKLQLARSLVVGVRYVSRAVDFDDDVNAYSVKLFDNSISALLLAKDRLPSTAIAKAVDHLAQAKRIYFFGLGTSAAVAKDASHKFFRLNVPVTREEDPLALRMLAAAGGVGDVFFFISHTGRTRVLVEVAELARSTEATVVSLTAPDSPLADQSHCSIALENSEDTEEYLPMTSRLVQLVMLDVLATGVTLRRGEGFQPHLARIKDSLRQTRFPAQ
ncbi:MAG: transcriptional regulator HexR [Gammaproteobacteria bacterium]|jgi:RpiR family transcriptional regulator, carbohydrate utilization regulator|nr:transcriptional regulator HexR [Gammaproteobacteria bacterium]